mmetsp:Transcript_40135/g.113504  ORF Transcript_40135/g.113504 Transcript_40135/m.113504 type:complete len:659 (+) Transcript_40135:48-2024(+)
MKQMMLPFATFSLYAALELFMTARANRPHEESYRDLKLDVGTSTGELELTLATGNLGGGKPQPEFLGGDWDKQFGEFEKLLGAMILATGKGCDPKEWIPDEKYARYSTDTTKQYLAPVCKKDTQFAEGGFQYGGKKYTLLEKARSFFAKNTDVGSFIATIKAVESKLGGIEFPDYNLTNKGVTTKIKPVKDLSNQPLRDIFGKELEESSRFSGPEACVKERRAFPYFEEGFMELVEWWNADKTVGKKEFMTKYLKDLRGTKEDLEYLCTKTGRGATSTTGLCTVEGKKARTNQQVSMCKSPQGDADTRGKLFTKEGLLDWVSMALWDVYVVQAFAQWEAQNGKEDPLVSMTDPAVGIAVSEVANYFKTQADIFFAQELGKPLCKSLLFTHCETMKEGETDTGTIDAAIFVKQAAGSKHVGDTEKVRTHYTKLLNAVIDLPGGGDQDWKKFIHNSQTNEKIATAKSAPEAPNPSVLGKVELAVAKLGKDGVPVLLVSAHPDSNGVLCAFQLYLVKKVFEEQKDLLTLKYLIVGMDVNLMTDGDYAQKGKKAGFNQAEFYPATVNALGFDVLWPENPTVNKQRTFLQTQLSKAGKHDQVKKDMVFIYPKDSLAGDPPKAKVYNKIPEANDPAKCYDSESKYPRDFWPMDHCVSIAGVTLK